MTAKCDHKFGDSTRCLKCGWSLGEARPALFGCSVCPYSSPSPAGWFEIDVVSDDRVLRFCPKHALAAAVLSGIGLSGDDTARRIRATIEIGG